MIYIYFFAPAIEFFYKIHLKSLRPKHNFLMAGSRLTAVLLSCRAVMPGSKPAKITTLQP
jgi:hypothetical protein